MNNAVSRLQQLLKHNTPPKNAMAVLTLLACWEDRRLCSYVFDLVSQKNQRLRSTSKAFISTHGPHGGVSTDTIAKWIKRILNKVEVDTTIFKAHCTRSVANSAASQSLGINHVLRTAGWANETTLAKLYMKSIENQSILGLKFASCVITSKSVSL